MTDYNIWPTNEVNKPRKGIVIPHQWLDAFNVALHQIKKQRGLYTDSHVIIVSVLELAQRIEEEKLA